MSNATTTRPEKLTAAMTAALRHAEAESEIHAGHNHVSRGRSRVTIAARTCTSLESRGLLVGDGPHVADSFRTYRITEAGREYVRSIAA